MCLSRRATSPLSQLQPTQLYISRAKLKRARAYLEAGNCADYEPLPVKQIGRLLFFTDGHSRALLLWRAGHAEIKTVLDTDDMEWASYLENVAAPVRSADFSRLLHQTYS